MIWTKKLALLSLLFVCSVNAREQCGSKNGKTCSKGLCCNNGICQKNNPGNKCYVKNGCDPNFGFCYGKLHIREENEEVEEVEEEDLYEYIDVISTVYDDIYDYTTIVEEVTVTSSICENCEVPTTPPVITSSTTIKVIKTPEPYDSELDQYSELEVAEDFDHPDSDDKNDKAIPNDNESEDEVVASGGMEKVPEEDDNVVASGKKEEENIKIISKEDNNESEDIVVISGGMEKDSEEHEDVVSGGKKKDLEEDEVVVSGEKEKDLEEDDNESEDEVIVSGEKKKIPEDDDKELNDEDSIFNDKDKILDDESEFDEDVIFNEEYDEETTVLESDNEDSDIDMTTIYETITKTIDEAPTNVAEKKKYHPWQCGEGIGSCVEGYCCSKYGWCGTGDKYCNVELGCQSEFGVCRLNGQKVTTPVVDGKKQYHPWQCGKGIRSCKEGYCCSKYGWCGKTGAYCDVERGCQSEFGECFVRKGATPTITVEEEVTRTSVEESTPTHVIEETHPWQCGKGIRSCKEGYCCSKYGWCGKTSAYCDIERGCQSEFGRCNDKPSSPHHSKKTIKKYHPWQCGKGIRSCKEGYCCSKYGWCGKSASYCSKDEGCQSEFGKCW